eukprot:CAMPEP_0201567910 /NCGR_PEP_ID=MMETSP0190_2-20130828/8659_1 /ASSEMBLY_ACC=CAM_ASM_000263 /TAXON_ID=37353 /ORGANISM="Rosalina sp." /LENGTH=255 /DNA_ID=CAMNT_0047988443 /DNA_START=145 /DNA_END=912 /DNA_ORIENTATION=+
MFTGNRLDYGVNTFSQEGRLFQVEYALEAIKLGSTALGIQTKEGVLLAVEKRVESKLMVPSSNNKIVEIDAHLGAVYSGLQADGRTLIDYARVQSQSYWFTYDEAMPVKSVTSSVADHMMSFAGTDDDDEEKRKKKMSRPFGVAFILAGVDDNKEPSLYVIDPSGTTVRYLAVAVGAGGESAMSVLQDRYAKSMTLREAEDLAAEILKQVMEAKINKENCEIALLSAKTQKFEKYNKEQIEQVLARIKREDHEED